MIIDQRRISSSRLCADFRVQQHVSQALRGADGAGGSFHPGDGAAPDTFLIHEGKTHRLDSVLLQLRFRCRRLTVKACEGDQWRTA